MPATKSKKSTTDPSARQRRVYSIVFIVISVIMVISMILSMLK